MSLGTSEFQSVLFQDIANNVMWFIGPSLYLYVIYNQKQPNTKFVLFHLLPFLLPAVVNVFLNWEAFDSIIPYIALPQMSIYLIATLIFCFKHYKQERHFYSWVLPSIVAFTFLVVINFGLRLLSNIDIQILPSSILQSFTTLLAFPIFYIAYKEMNAANAYGIQPKKYKTTPLSIEKSKDYLVKIQSALENDKHYQNTSLKLSTFSAKIDIPSKYISQLINQNLNLSFTEYLTKLRIEDAKGRLKNPKKQHLTISGIAEESGFASSSRFNHLFKKHTGLTPTQYQKQAL